MLIHNARKDGSASQLSPVPMSSTRRQTSSKPYFKLTSDYAFLAHVQRASGRPSTAQTDKETIRTGVRTSDSANMPSDTTRVLAQAFKTPLSEGRHRYGINILQRNDHVLSGKYDPVTVVLAFQGLVANVTLGVGLHTIVFDA